MLAHANGHRRALRKYAGGLPAVAASLGIGCGILDTSISSVLPFLLFFVFVFKGERESIVTPSLLFSEHRCSSFIQYLMIQNCNI
jgi:hypothetical protein